MEEKDFYILLGKRYKQLREKQGIKQLEAATRAGLSSGDLSKFENKGKKLSAYRIKRLVEAIDLKLSDFFIEDAEKKNELQVTISGNNLKKMNKSTLEKIKASIRLFFSPELWQEIAEEEEAKELERRNATAQNNHQQHECDANS